MLDRIFSLARLDFAPRHRQPPWWKIASATVLAVAGSLIADMVLVRIGKALWPATKHFQHFQFSDYGKLTVVGVIVACIAWPIVTRISSDPRWLFFRMAIAVTLVLWLPDLYILYLGESPRGVAVLMVMHLAIAVVTYNVLVRIAPVQRAQTAGAGPAHAAPRAGAAGPGY
jgi:hypothetical protein